MQHFDFLRPSDWLNLTFLLYKKKKVVFAFQEQSADVGLVTCDFGMVLFYMFEF